VIRCLLALLLLAPALARADEGACVEVVVEKVRSADGVVRVALFADEASYEATENARHLEAIPAAEGAVRTRICGLPAGCYALSVFHDANANAELDTNRIGIPREGYGFSNGVRGRTGPPAFAKVAFDLAAGGSRTETIRLLYWLR